MKRYWAPFENYGDNGILIIVLVYVFAQSSILNGLIVYVTARREDLIGC